MPRQAGAGGHAPQGAIDRLDRLHRIAAEQLVERLESGRRAMGPPWRSRHLSEVEQLARTDDWDVPVAALPAESQAVAERLGKGEAARAALEAIRLRQRARERGEWPALPPLLAGPEEARDAAE